MTHILIIESNPAAESARLRELGGASCGELYAATLTSLRPDLKTTIIAPYDGDDIEDLTPFDGVAFTGSSVEWNTDDAQAEPLAAIMRRCFAAGLPVIGSCNGMQLAASILGGSTAESPNGREDGLAGNIKLTDAGKTHPMMVGREDGYAVPCTHRDEVVRLPDAAMLLAGNDHSAVQAFAVEQDGIHFWGMQYHPEFDVGFVGKYLGGSGRLAESVAMDLEMADQDVSAAARLGTTPEAQELGVRATELRNWLDRIAPASI